MREHRPEALECRRGDSDAELGHVTLEERPHEVAAPRGALGIRARRERPWEPAAQPEPVAIRHAHFVEGESGELVIGDSSGQRLGTLAQQLGCRAAEDEKPGRRTWPVGEHPKRWKQVGPALDTRRGRRDRGADRAPVRGPPASPGLAPARDRRRWLARRAAPATARASVVLPACRAPSNATTGFRASRRAHGLSVPSPFDHPNKSTLKFGCYTSKFHGAVDGSAVRCWGVVPSRTPDVGVDGCSMPHRFLAAIASLFHKGSASPARILGLQEAEATLLPFCLRRLPESGVGFWSTSDRIMRLRVFMEPIQHLKHQDVQCRDRRCRGAETARNSRRSLRAQR